MVPIGSPHKKNAEILMNYYYDPEVAAEVAAYVNYICPVKGAQEAMEKIDPELGGEPADLPERGDPAKVEGLPHAHAGRGDAVQRRLPARCSGV